MELRHLGKQELYMDVGAGSQHNPKGSSRGVFFKAIYDEGQHPEELCLCSRDMRLKVREHEPHWYFFTSEWVCRWARRLERSAKARLQC